MKNADTVSLSLFPLSPCTTADLKTNRDRTRGMLVSECVFVRMCVCAAFANTNALIK